MPDEEGDSGSLYRKYARRLMGYFRRRRGLGPQDAEDAVQEVFRRLLARVLPKCAAISDLERWIFGTARNVASDILRRRARTAAQPLADEIPGKPDDSAEAKERSKAVHEAVRKLPDDLRTLLLLRYWKRWSCRRIGARLGMTANAVSMRLYRARMLVRRLLRGRV